MIDKTALEAEYDLRCRTGSDINEHLPTLREYAARVRHVTEMGVDTSANSTVAMIAASPGHMISYDLQDLDVSLLAALAKSSGVDWSFRRANVLEIEIAPTDLLFVDTWHHYIQLKAEFELHIDKVRRYVAMHDTETFRDIGSGHFSGGLWQAVEEAVATGQWAICHVAVNNNGLAILERKAPPTPRIVNVAIVDEAKRLVQQEFAEYLTPGG